MALLRFPEDGITRRWAPAQPTTTAPAPAPTQTTRDQAWTQYQDAYKQAGAGDLLTGDYQGEAEREFGDWWKHASESGELQGIDNKGTGTSWASLMPDLTNRISGRIAERQSGVTQPDSNQPAPPLDVQGFWGNMWNGGGTAGGGSNSGSGSVSGFDDPYTVQLEDRIRKQLATIETPQANPALDNLNQFLAQRFGELTTTPGYSPEDLALIRTQMLEPIERDRAAGRQRVEQRTAARGFLPSSGLHEQDLQEFVDRPAEEQRIAAQRDIAINAINKRNQDLNQALNVGRFAGIEIPQWQQGQARTDRGEALSLSSLLYDLPNRAMQSAQSVINGTAGPQDLFSQAVQLQQLENQRRTNNFNMGAQCAATIKSAA